MSTIAIRLNTADPLPWSWSFKPFLFSQFASSNEVQVQQPPLIIFYSSLGSFHFNIYSKTNLIHVSYKFLLSFFPSHILVYYLFDFYNNCIYVLIISIRTYLRTAYEHIELVLFGRWYSKWNQIIYISSHLHLFTPLKTSHLRILLNLKHYCKQTDGDYYAILYVICMQFLMKYLKLSWSNNFAT